MGVPSQDFSTAITRGTNFMVDGTYVLSGSTNLYLGNSSRCFKGGKLKSTVQPYDIKKGCFTDPVEEFFTFFLPKRFYQAQSGQPFDKQLDKMSCDELAAKSKAALTKYWR